MSGRANVTLRKACSAVELLGTADGEGWCSADRSLLEEPQHSPAAGGTAQAVSRCSGWAGHKGL